MIDQVYSQTEKLSFLIDSLVKASYLESELITINTKNEEIYTVIADAVTEIGAEARAKAITISNGVGGGVRCNYDYKWTKEVLVNILDNAIKYSNPGTTIDISTSALEIYLKIDIKDQGIGVDEKEYGAIFGRFYRSHDVAESEGLGIGLYLARKIVSLQGGYIKLKSKKGKGSLFSIYLPR